MNGHTGGRLWITAVIIAVLVSGAIGGLGVYLDHQAKKREHAQERRTHQRERVIVRRIVRVQRIVKRIPQAVGGVIAGTGPKPPSGQPPGSGSSPGPAPIIQQVCGALDQVAAGLGAPPIC
jgi:hypothetical protein